VENLHNGSGFPTQNGGWPIFLDPYFVGFLPISGAIVAHRKEPLGELMIAAGCRFSCGILYFSFFEQLEDANRHSGP
jgi:hypothetical protein